MRPKLVLSNNLNPSHIKKKVFFYYYCNRNKLFIKDTNISVYKYFFHILIVLILCKKEFFLKNSFFMRAFSLECFSDAIKEMKKILECDCFQITRFVFNIYFACIFYKMFFLVSFSYYNKINAIFYTIFLSDN